MADYRTEVLECMRTQPDWQTIAGVLYDWPLRGRLPALWRRGWKCWSKTISGVLHGLAADGRLLRQGGGEVGDPWRFRIANPGASSAEQSASADPDDWEAAAEAEGEHPDYVNGARANAWIAAVEAAPPDRHGRSARAYLPGLRSVPEPWLLRARVEGVCSVGRRGGQVWIFPRKDEDSILAVLEDFGSPTQGWVLVNSAVSAGVPREEVGRILSELHGRGAVRREFGAEPGYYWALPGQESAKTQDGGPDSDTDK